MEQVLQIPARMRIDNAANIYPASLSKRYASLYRMSVTLCEPVDTNCLQQALETVSLRIPTFRCGLRSGAFWASPPFAEDAAGPFPGTVEPSAFHG